MLEQPWILWGLPLIALPVIIHLLNRLRFRSINWAAMIFLLAATRHSTKQARIKQILILLCRVLAVAFLVFALSRPIVGGWLGLAFGGPPKTIILLFDRSASMEMVEPGTQESKRQRALDMITRGIKQNNSGARLVLIDSASMEAQEIINPDLLPELPTMEATDSAADIPAMIEAALTYMIDNDTGKTEVWIVSDLQRSNWRPDNGTWETQLAQVSSLKQSVQFRLLALPGETKTNVTLAIRDVIRFRSLGKPQLQLSFDVHRHPEAATDFPIKLEMAGRPPQELDTSLSGGSLTVKHRLRLEKDTGRGWGRLTLPNDDSPQDNTAYFAFDKERPLHALVLAQSLVAGRYLLPAAAVLAKAEQKSIDRFHEVNLNKISLVIWQGALPGPEQQKRLKEFVEDGGILLCLPSEDVAGSLFDELSWGDLQVAPGDSSYNITHWDREHGPLSNSASGWVLPLDELRVWRRRQPLMKGETIAEFGDDTPFLVQRRLGRGQLLACASIPRKEWSDLHHTTVLVPMIQRLLYQGAKRLAETQMLDCGDFTPKEGENWRPVEGTNGDPRWNAGIYEFGTRRVALNRPAAEDSPEIVPTDDVKKLFGGQTFHMFRDTGADDDAVPSEIWRLMLYLMLVVMVLESLLTLPSRFIVKGTGNALE